MQLYEGVYRSRDGGRSWTRVLRKFESDPGATPVRDEGNFTVSTVTADTVAVWLRYADGSLKTSSAFYYSSDGGSTWTSVFDGENNSPYNQMTLSSGTRPVLANDLGLYFKSFRHDPAGVAL